jgi:hypothetical protein
MVQIRPHPRWSDWKFRLSWRRIIALFASISLILPCPTMSNYGACQGLLLHSATNLEKRSGEWMVGGEIVLVDKIVGC